MAKEFDSHLKTVMLNLSNSLRNDDLTVKEKNAEVLKSKFFLYDVCFEKAINLLTLENKKDDVLIFETVKQGVCASFVYLSQQITVAEQIEKYTPLSEKTALAKQVEKMSSENEEMNQKIVTLEEHLQAIESEK